MFEENEVSKNANGGTELTKRILGKMIDPNLMNECQLIASRLRELDESKVRVYWANDLPGDPECAKFRDANLRNKLHALVFTSNWQYQQFQLQLGIPYQKNYHVIEPAVEPIVPDESKYVDNKKINICYTCTPQRGLNILVPVFAKLQEKYGEEIHLDVFSSFKIYGWDEMDKQFEPLYDMCRNNPGITYHGFQPHDVVQKYLAEQGHIMAYPSIWQETSCRCIIEAMSAKLLCVHPNYGALFDTSGMQNLIYGGDNNPEAHANVFINALDQAIILTKNKDQAYAYKLAFNKQFADSRFNAQRIAFQWSSLLKSLIDQFPTVESRKFASEMFSYRQ